MVTRSPDELTFTTAEAAVIVSMAGLSPGGEVSKRAVDGLIEKKLIPSAVVRRRQNRRALTRVGLDIVGAEFSLRRTLPVTALRKRVYGKMASIGTRGTRIAADDAVLVDVRKPAARIADAIRRFRRLMSLIERRPDVQRGEPVIKGTRVTAYTIAAIAEQGTPAGEILQHYPGLDEEGVEAATTFARAYPQRGRPALPSAGRVLVPMTIQELGAR